MRELITKCDQKSGGSIAGYLLGEKANFFAIDVFLT